MFSIYHAISVGLCILKLLFYYVIYCVFFHIKPFIAFHIFFSLLKIIFFLFHAYTYLFPILKA